MPSTIVCFRRLSLLVPQSASCSRVQPAAAAVAVPRAGVVWTRVESVLELV